MESPVLRYGVMPRRISTEIALANIRLFDAWVAAWLEECDVFVGLSGSGLKAGRVAQGRGAKYVCDRGSSHIRYQRAILDEEYARWGFPGERVDPRVVVREGRGNVQADAITIPSEFARRTFVEMGVDGQKFKESPMACGWIAL